MLKRLLIASFLWLASVISYAQQGLQTMTATTEQLSELYRKMNVAMVNADITTLDQLLSDDFTLTHITGYEQPKAEWLAEIQQQRMHYFSTKEVSVEVQGNQLIGQAVTTANIWGVQGSWPLQLTIDFIQHNGQWQMQKAVATLFH